jgi:hypothetical protein
MYCWWRCFLSHKELPTNLRVMVYEWQTVLCEWCCWRVITRPKTRQQHWIFHPPSSGTEPTHCWAATRLSNNGLIRYWVGCRCPGSNDGSYAAETMQSLCRSMIKLRGKFESCLRIPGWSNRSTCSYKIKCEMHHSRLSVFCVLAVDRLDRWDKTELRVRNVIQLL